MRGAPLACLIRERFQITESFDLEGVMRLSKILVDLGGSDQLLHKDRRGDTILDVVITCQNHHLELAEYLLEQTAGSHTMQWPVGRIGGGMRDYFWGTENWLNWSEETLAGMLVLLMRWDLLSLEQVEEAYQTPSFDSIIVKLVKSTIENRRQKSARSHQ